MNFFEAFEKKDCENIAIIKSDNRLYSIKDLKPIIASVCQKLLQSECKNILICSKNNFSFLINFLAGIYAQKHIFILPDLRKKVLLDFDYLILDDVENDNIVDFEFKSIDLNEAFFSICTSGSTSKPKILRKNIAGLLKEAEDIIKEFEKIKNCKETELTTSTTPLHMFGMTCYIGLQLYNCEKFIINEKEILYPDQANLKDKIFISTPAFLEKFKKHDISLNDKPLVILSAGDRIKPEVFEYFERQKINLVNIYGSTETGIIAYSTAQNQEALTCFGNVKISTDKTSQIVIDSPYFIENNMVLCDIIEIKNNRMFVLKQRNDRILKIQEKRVSAHEIEDILKTSQYIEASYCFKYEDKLACAVVLNNYVKELLLNENINHTSLIKELKAIVKNKSEIIPQKWRFVYEIPKTQTGKVDTEKLKRIFGLNLSLPLIFEIKKEEQEASLELAFLKESNFFDGHFTGFPILPGVAQLYFAHKYAEYIFNRKIKNTQAKRVKFSHIIKPNKKVKLCFKMNENNINYSYKIENDIYSSGILAI